MQVQDRSKSRPRQDRGRSRRKALRWDEGDVRQLVYEAIRRADAMGLAREPETAGSAAESLDLETVQRLAHRVRQAGIARGPAVALGGARVPARAELEGLLRMLITALEESPAPKYEWPSLGRVFEPEQLAALLGISVSSLRRYQAGERTTPDAVAARLHFLALVVGDLAGAYNEIGIRRWFDRPRSQLGGRTPASYLAGEWDPGDEGPQRVRALARALTTLSVT
jgi:transcriptional regulator with XRE-family HTH domain